MRFELVQHIAAPVSAVTAAFADPDFYDAMGALPKLGTPQVLSREAVGDVVTLRVRYQFTGELSSAARAVLDPERLTWVDESVHDLAAQTVRFTLRADHYADRFRCAGSYRFAAVTIAGAGPGTERRSEGELKIRAPLVGSMVEKAIVSGLREHLEEEVGLVEEFLRRSRTA